MSRTLIPLGSIKQWPEGPARDENFVIYDP